MQEASRKVSASDVDVFFETLKNLHTTPHLASDARETVEIIKGILSEAEPRSVVAAGLPTPARMLVETTLKGVKHSFVEDLKPSEVVGVVSAAEMGITWAQYAAAKHGAIAEIVYDDATKLASSLPRTHVALLSSTTVLPDLTSVLSQIAEVVRSADKKPTVSLISGPSKTADIEMRLIYGVHGPHALHVVVLDWI